MIDDERIVWVRASMSRKIIQIIEPMPQGFSVTTQWKDGDEIVRQDCEVALREMPPMSGGASSFN